MSDTSHQVRAPREVAGRWPRGPVLLVGGVIVVGALGIGLIAGGLLAPSVDGELGLSEQVSGEVRAAVAAADERCTAVDQERTARPQNATLASVLGDARLEYLTPSIWPRSDGEFYVEALGETQVLVARTARTDPPTTSFRMLDLTVPGDAPREFAGFGDRAVLDLLLDVESSTLYYSYLGQEEGAPCLFVGLSSAPVVDGVPQFDQEQGIFRTAPCVALADGPQAEYGAGQSGGRIELVDGELYLTVGDMRVGPSSLREQVASEGLELLSEPWGYGATYAIALSTGEPRRFTEGHRNPQGLARQSNGALWLTEHGASGGSEVNLLEEGRDYGWRDATFSRPYDGLDSLTDPGFYQQYSATFGELSVGLDRWCAGAGVAPTFILPGDSVANVAPSQVVFITTADERELGMVGTLAGTSLLFFDPAAGQEGGLWRVHLGERVRDISVATDRRLYISTDSGAVLQLTVGS